MVEKDPKSTLREKTIGNGWRILEGLYKCILDKVGLSIKEKKTVELKVMSVVFDEIAEEVANRYGTDDWQYTFVRNCIGIAKCRSDDQEKRALAISNLADALDGDDLNIAPYDYSCLRWEIRDDLFFVREE